MPDTEIIEKQVRVKARGIEFRFFDPLPVGFVSYILDDEAQSYAFRSLNTGYFRNMPENADEYNRKKGYPRNESQRLRLAYTDAVGSASFSEMVFIDEDCLEQYTQPTLTEYTTVPVGLPFSRNGYEFLIDIDSGKLNLYQKDEETGETKILRAQMQLTQEEINQGTPVTLRYS